MPRGDDENAPTQITDAVSPPDDHAPTQITDAVRLPGSKRTKLGVAVHPDHEPVELDAADHALVARLRALPPEGNEPDWRKLQAAIRARTAPLRAPALWWRNWRWLAPIGALALSATIGVGLGLRDDTPTRTAVVPELLRDASVDHDPRIVSEQSERRDAERAPAMWLDGEPVDVDDIEPEQLDALLQRAVGDELGATFGESLDGATGELRAPDAAELDQIGVLPPADYRWIDSVDDDAAARIESWLARNPS